MQKHIDEKIVGVVAGVGPYAGLDMLRKIFDQTVAQGDADHLTVVGWYQSNAVPDRTKFLLGESSENPGQAIATQLYQLEKSGASVAAIPCNTAHAPEIFDVACDVLKSQGSALNVLHMIREVATYLDGQADKIECVGVLSTTGTYDTAIYPNMLEPLGYQVVVPPRDWQEDVVNPTIYDPVYGVKATGGGTEKARHDLFKTISMLREAGAQAIILGCTELPLAIPETEVDGIPMIDPTLILARAVIRAVDPAKLRP